VSGRVSTALQGSRRPLIDCEDDWGMGREPSRIRFTSSHLSPT
jgi:hypothetical protein